MHYNKRHCVWCAWWILLHWLLRFTVPSSSKTQSLQTRTRNKNTRDEGIRYRMCGLCSWVLFSIRAELHQMERLCSQKWDSERMWQSCERCHMWTEAKGKKWSCRFNFNYLRRFLQISLRFRKPIKDSKQLASAETTEVLKLSYCCSPPKEDAKPFDWQLNLIITLAVVCNNQHSIADECLLHTRHDML